MENEEGCTIHLKVRMENDELVDKAILCPSCGGEARTFKACDGDGACYALLACMLCGNSLAACATDEEMERNLEEIWRGGKACLLRARKNWPGPAGGGRYRPGVWHSVTAQTVRPCRRDS